MMRQGQLGRALSFATLVVVSVVLLHCGGGSAKTSGGQAGASTGRDGASAGADDGRTVIGNTGNVFVDESAGTAIDRIDLLFMVDNSAAMQDKQDLLAQAVPVLLDRLLNPPCVTVEANAAGEHTPLDASEQPTSPSGDCPSGYVREFPPVPDVHIGVVTSSMGGHGNPEFCNQAMQDDHAHLLTANLRPGPTMPATYDNAGFLNWDNRSAGDPRKATPPGISDIGTLTRDFTALITAVGEEGCGYEASLEAWYRFLIDPDPPAAVSFDPNSNMTVRSAEADATILAQRKAFLRPDSLVAIIMLTDENDCSIMDANYGWLASQPKIDKGTARCAENPNDQCCTFCGYVEAPAGCPALSTDAGCQTGKDDATHVRCWDQKRRFGIDFLYPTSRYSTGLDSIELCPDSDFGDNDCQCRRAKELGIPCSPGKPVRNPLYTDLQHSAQVIVPAKREPWQVFLAGIVGVPWQDLATDETREAPDQLAYKRPNELDWALFYGAPTTKDNPLGTKPTDALMWEDTAPRTDGPVHPLLGVAPAPPASTDPNANPVNGHEWNPANHEDLEYACVFDLAPMLDGKPRDCAEIGTNSCECFDPTDDLATVSDRLKPLCQQDDGSYSTVQTRAKAYPGLRELEVLRFYGDNSIVASICPKVLEGLGTSDANYGYNPAIHAIIDRITEKLGGRCLSRKLDVDQNGRVPCQVVEALSSDPDRCSELTGRQPVDTSNSEDAALDEAVRDALNRANQCGIGTAVDCNSFTLCKIQQLQRAELAACQREPTTDESIHGYCYIADRPEQQVGNPAFVANCPEAERQSLRFLGDSLPAADAVTVIACE
ncbi:MAG: hypothetical protein JW940_35055 [Polyangiaceae bacterium]|nr:hypothetical protein [Polyangiaceae bacterium]